MATSAPSRGPDRPLPEAARRLGNAGLAPFLVGVVLVWLVDDRAREVTALGLSVYAAVVVSFLGGIHWGVGFDRDEAPGALFLWGVVPTSLAWVAVMMPASAGLVLNAVVLVLCYLVDRKIYPALGLQRWLTLRFRLSAVAATCCFLAAGGA